MEKILFEFNLSIVNDFYQSHFDVHGPVFGKFLPNGREESITKIIKPLPGKLSLWFEREGFMDNFSSISFKEGINEIDENIIHRQDRIKAGRLFGSFELEKSYEDYDKFFDCLKKADFIDNPIAISFSKKFVRHIGLEINNFIKILKFTYNQYWLKEIDLWDSVKGQSLGVYENNTYHLRYTIDNGKTFYRYKTDNNPMVVNATLELKTSENRYLTKRDWNFLQTLYNTDVKVKNSSILFSKVYSMYEMKDYDSALIFAVTCLEEFASEKRGSNSNLLDSTLKAANDRFFNAIDSSTNRLIFLYRLHPEIKESAIVSSLKAIELRHNIIHNGIHVKPDDISNILMFILVLSHFIMPSYKLPELGKINSSSISKE